MCCIEHQMTIQSPLVYELYNLASSERHLHHCAVDREAESRGGELGVLRLREYPLVGKSTLSKLKKNFIKNFVILTSNKNMTNYVRIRVNP